MKIYIIASTSVIEGKREKEIHGQAYRTKEAAKNVLNDAFKYWMSEAKKHYEDTDDIIVETGNYSFHFYDKDYADEFDIEYSVETVELSNDK